MRIVFVWVTLLLLGACSPEEAPDVRPPATELPMGRLPEGEATISMADFAGLKLPGAQVEVQRDWLGIALQPSEYEPVLVAHPDEGISPVDALSDHNLQVLVGSGFVSELHSLEPVGLLKADGRTLSTVQRHGYTRILGINEQGLGVVHREQYESGLFHSALQAGPGIIEAGRLDILRRDLKRPKYFRSFVVLCEQHWVLGVTRAPMNLYTLGETLLESPLTKGCEEVINLAGDREAVLAIRVDDQVFFHGNPETYRVSLLGMRLK